MNAIFSGHRCWQQERIGVVISKLALSVDRAEFLATHMPMRRILYERSPQRIPRIDETSLLEELDRASIEGRHVFVVVKGIPGTGKSHLIRWLKEQYGLTHPQDAVLLVARANTSLRGTIQQIIDSHVFDEDTLPQQLQRLQGAVDVLNQESLGEKLLNGLQEAVHAADWDAVQERLGLLHRRVTSRKVELFLLDHQVRDLLKREGGPIQRVARFLTSGTDSTVGIDRAPGFEAADFEISVDFLRKIRMNAYPEVKELCDNLHQKPEIRADLARYLNHELHGHAISVATNLAAGDLLAMFTELRRHLRDEGRELALFIEDITALTGIDEGLIEVLISEHRGEGGAGLCRISSVVGVTDSVYADRLPDNVKERVTHLLALNAGDGRQESDLLRDSDVRAEFAARYLNAIRVAPSELHVWAERGALPDALPNACQGCPFQAPCHAAFGAVALRDDRGHGPDEPVGLYPFNGRSLDTLYSYLKESVSRTPRTFLSELLGYILQSHGDLVAAGEFPPVPAELVYSVNLPSFDPPAHLRIVEQVGRPAASRLETLFLFWGTRNVFSEIQGGVPRVGGLSPGVFTAFKLPAFLGRPSETDHLEELDQTRRREEERQQEEKRKRDAEQPREPAGSPYTKLINDWANGGKLYQFDKFADWLADLALSFIDWQSHGISSTQVKDYVTGRRFVIEDQSGAVVTPGLLHLRFARSDELRYVLQALADLSDTRSTLIPDQYGEHLATLSHWIRSEEDRIITFVREPTGQASSRDYLMQILLLNCVGLSCLAGELRPSAAESSVELYQQIIASCARSTEDGWKKRLELQKATQPSDWNALMRRVDMQKAVHICRTELLQLMNRPQGASTSVRYLDAAAAVAVLADFNQTGWSYAPLPIQFESNDRTWTSAMQVYRALAEGFSTACKSAQQMLRAHHERLRQHVGNEPPAALFGAIWVMLGDLRQIREYSQELNAPFEGDGVHRMTPDELAGLLEYVDKQLAIENLHAIAAGLSANYHAWHEAQRKYLDYFDLFAKRMNAEKTWLTKEIDALRQQSSASEQITQTLAQYDETIALLNSIATEGDS